MSCQTMGRYEIVGTLAHGGMAEILLGRLSGPSGFERLVVIKRILPHYASNPGFRTMFLDEARIAASIRNDNVVQHHELEQSEGELFLVMDYLEGEVLSGVRRRVRSRGVELEPEVGAFIVAEACAGLHAAHELVSLDGIPQEVVHRDISPHNIFVTYDGTIKVIDFGIAKAASRITVTEAGQLKGKFGYMSPEQAAGEELDRRSDIYALGIVLYEILSGRRLFRRATHSSTLAAILEGIIPPIQEVFPDCPSQLVPIVERALAKDREKRFPTTQQMRRELLKAISDFAPSSLPREILADLMNTLFHERREEKRKMLQQARLNRGIVENIPPSEVDPDIEIPEVPKNAFIESSPSEEDKTVLSSLFTPFRTRAFVLIGIGVLVVLGLFFSFGIFSNNGTLAQSEVQPPVAEKTGETDQPREAEPQHVELHFETEPPGALLNLGGKTFGTTPLTIHIPRRSQPIEATLSLDRHVTRSFTLVASTNQRLHYSLDSITTKSSKSRRRRGTKEMKNRQKRKSAKQPEGTDWSKVRF